MRRIHLIELHEQSWYPSRWRQLFQRSLGHGMVVTGAFDNVIEPLRQLLQRARPDSILDLCSGSGDVTMKLWKSGISTVTGDNKPKLIMSDLYPDIDAYSAFKEIDPESIDFYPHSVNALGPPSDAPRVWMLTGSFHHFRPEEARNILRNAAKHADGLVVLESTNRTWRQLAQVLFFSFFFTMITTAFLLRPFRFENLLWGLLLPVIPLTLAFDAIVSNLRTYTVKELEEMTRSIGGDFKWEVGTAAAPKTGGLRVTYLMGWRGQLATPS